MLIDLFKYFILLQDRLFYYHVHIFLGDKYE